MRKFDIGEKVFIERNSMIQGEIIDTKYFGLFRLYAVKSIYASRYWNDDDPEKIHIDWLGPYEIIKIHNN